MFLIQPLDVYQTQLRSTQFTNKIFFVKGLANYIETMTLTSSSLFRALITILESPQRIIEENPSSKSKEIALVATNASTSSNEVGRLTFSNMKAKTWP